MRMTVEVPVTPKDARRRNLPNEIAKLILDASPECDHGRAVGMLSSMIGSWCRQDETLYAAPINLLETVAALQSRVQGVAHASGMRWLDQESSVVAFDGATALSEFLQACDSEAVVIVIGAAEQKVVETMAQAFSERCKHNQYELPYLNRVEVHQGFVFYAASHRSVEILGTPPYVVGRCLAPIVERSNTAGLTPPV